MWHSRPWQCFCLDIYSSFWSLSSKGDCPALWPFLKQILGRSSSHVALIEMIGGGGVVSALCLTRAYLPGAKPGETGTGGGKEREEGEEEKKKNGLCFALVVLPAICPSSGSETGGGTRSLPLRRSVPPPGRGHWAPCRSRAGLFRAAASRSRVWVCVVLSAVGHAARRALAAQGGPGAGEVGERFRVASWKWFRAEIGHRPAKWAALKYVLGIVSRKACSSLGWVTPPEPAACGFKGDGISFRRFVPLPLPQPLIPW